MVTIHHNGDNGVRDDCEEMHTGWGIRQPLLSRPSSREILADIKHYRIAESRRKDLRRVLKPPIFIFSHRLIADSTFPPLPRSLTVLKQMNLDGTGGPNPLERRSQVGLCLFWHRLAIFGKEKRGGFQASSDGPASLWRCILCHTGCLGRRVG
ncbi:hypothetical protein BaRGS_00015299 [Batillaria attramentaria]|uniref:Uncharacterized protein n=1 Tax=Batillaria attramentaria TaxID=370345 RepID=A0ABD0L1X2_9CAEN